MHTMQVFTPYKTAQVHVMTAKMEMARVELASEMIPQKRLHS